MFSLLGSGGEKNKAGVKAAFRSHPAATQHPWARRIRGVLNLFRGFLGVYTLLVRKGVFSGSVLCDLSPPVSPR